MGTSRNLDSDASGNMVDQKMYWLMIGSLLYVTASRPDVMFSVCMCARLQGSPRESHLKATKGILRYLRHTPNVGLWYLKGARFELIGYLDSDYAGCKVKRKSTSDTCQLLGRSLVSWSPKKQNSVALSTAEGEYILAGSCCTQLLWMKATLNDFGIKFKQVPLLCDNECREAHQLPGSTFKNKAHRCPPSFHKSSPIKGGHLHWECGHRWSTCRYIHQASWWEEVLQAKKWIE
jgi:hypothetical protein